MHVNPNSPTLRTPTPELPIPVQGNVQIPANRFSTSPKAEGDRIEELRCRVKDISNRLETFESEKIHLQMDRLESLIELHKTGQPVALNQVDLKLEIEQFAVNVQRESKLPPEVAEFLVEAAEYCIEGLSRSLGATLLEVAATACKRNQQIELSKQVSMLISVNNAAMTSYASNLGPVWM